MTKWLCVCVWICLLMSWHRAWYPCRVHIVVHSCHAQSFSLPLLFLFVCCSMGYCVLVAEGFSRACWAACRALKSRGAWSYAAVTFTGLVILFTVKTVSQNGEWHDRETLFRYVWPLQLTTYLINVVRVSGIRLCFARQITTWCKEVKILLVRGQVGENP